MYQEISDNKCIKKLVVETSQKCITKLVLNKCMNHNLVTTANFSITANKLLNSDQNRIRNRGYSCVYNRTH